MRDPLIPHEFSQEILNNYIKEMCNNLYYELFRKVFESYSEYNKVGYGALYPYPTFVSWGNRVKITKPELKVKTNMKKFNKGDRVYFNNCLNMQGTITDVYFNNDITYIYEVCWDNKLTGKYNYGDLHLVPTVKVEEKEMEFKVGDRVKYTNYDNFINGGIGNIALVNRFATVAKVFQDIKVIWVKWEEKEIQDKYGNISYHGERFEKVEEAIKMKFKVGDRVKYNRKTAYSSDVQNQLATITYVDTVDSYVHVKWDKEELNTRFDSCAVWMECNFEKVEAEFKVGDRVKYTRKLIYPSDVQDQLATVMSIAPEKFNVKWDKEELNKKYDVNISIWMTSSFDKVEIPEAKFKVGDIVSLTCGQFQDYYCRVEEVRYSGLFMFNGEPSYYTYLIKLPITTGINLKPSLNNYMEHNLYKIANQYASLFFVGDKVAIRSEQRIGTINNIYDNNRYRIDVNGVEYFYYGQDLIKVPDISEAKFKVGDTVARKSNTGEYGRINEVEFKWLKGMGKFTWSYAIHWSSRHKMSNDCWQDHELELINVSDDYWYDAWQNSEAHISVLKQDLEVACKQIKDLKTEKNVNSPIKEMQENIEQLETRLKNQKSQLEYYYKLLDTRNSEIILLNNSLNQINEDLVNGI